MPTHSFAPLRGSLETLTIASRALEGNLLGDPTTRQVVVYLPEGYEDGADEYPLMVDLVGFTGSGFSHVGWKAFWESVPQRAERLIQLAQQQRDFSRAIRISLDEAIIQDIIDRPDVPELIRTSPLTRREWQLLSLIHAGLSNDQIAGNLKVAAKTVKTHIRSLYQKQNISHRSEAIELAKDLLSKVQGD